MATTGFAERVAFGRVVDPLRDENQAFAAPRPGTMLAGRFLLAAIFFVSGYAKLTDPAGTIAHMTAAGIPAADVLAYVAGFAEILGAVSLLFGFLTRIGALGLILFMIPTTLVFHNFWAYEGAEQRMQLVNFLKNLGILGGLSLLVACGAGRYSVDSKLRWPNPP
ncbi:MAG: DoxX family protein [Deltaproteobacteria bacterium]|nr:DoxX family protein [Deltaproteobacteria bacterium]MCW5800988.1 DoxX family protein [Deltaproteobacteria bacterium]